MGKMIVTLCRFSAAIGNGATIELTGDVADAKIGGIAAWFNPSIEAQWKN